MNHSLPESNTPKLLTAAQQTWLDEILASMMQTIQYELERVDDDQTELKKVLREDHYLRNVHLYYDGVLREARYMRLPRHQFPDFIQMWVDYQAKLGKGPPVRKEQSPVYLEAVANGEIKEK